MTQTPRTRRLSKTLQVARNTRDRVFRAASLNRAGLTPFEVLHEDDIVSLRYYPPSANANGKPNARMPLVFVPPLAVNMLIYDLFAERSLVAYFRDAGFPVYLIDWGRPSRRHAHLHLQDYIADLLPKALKQVRSHSGQQRLSLHGWSLGAMFAYAYTALGDPDITNLVLVGPPCDYHAGGGVSWQNRLLARQLKTVRKLTGWGVHRSQRTLWHTPGWANSLAFKLASPTGTLKGYSELLGRLHDREFVANHATNGAFLDDMVAYPGGVMQDIIQYLVTDNVLAQGRLPFAESTARLSDIQANVLVVLGDADPIVPPASSNRLLSLIGSKDKSTLPVPGGHMSIVSGSRAPSKIWPHVAAWLEARA